MFRKPERQLKSSSFYLIIIAARIILYFPINTQSDYLNIKICNRPARKVVDDAKKALIPHSHELSFHGKMHFMMINYK